VKPDDVTPLEEQAAAWLAAYDHKPLVGLAPLDPPYHPRSYGFAPQENLKLASGVR
jgi:hypothetical protein